jgi:Amt family ammonium transporter
VGYTAVATYIVLKLVDLVTGLRVSPDEEIEGLDISSHEERGYVI